MISVAEQRLTSVVRNMTGVCIHPEKYRLFEQRFAGLMRDYDMAGYSEMAGKISATRDLFFLGRVIEQVAVHETRFFRDESFFQALRLKIIPDLTVRAAAAAVLAEQPLRIWSAACSTGQEIWSVAILLAEYFPEFLPFFRLYASDISAEAVERAEAGFYSAFEISRGMPSHLLLKYFTVSGRSFRIRKDLLPAVEFSRQNLLTHEMPPGMDIVLCRNVGFYFTEQEYCGVLSRIREKMNTPGILVLGASESPRGAMVDCITRKWGLARYYEIHVPP